MFKRILNNTKHQLYKNANNIAIVGSQTASNTSNITGVNQNVVVTQSSSSNNFSNVGNAVNNIYQILSTNSLVGSLATGRTITFYNNTAATNLDLYLTIGGGNPQPPAYVTTINTTTNYVWSIPQTYNWSGNFTAMPAGAPLLQYNAGPTIAEFGLNQVWSGSTPEIRDTFDISTVPPGIGTGANNGPRSLAVSLSQQAGFSVQQSYNYNFGITLTPPAITGGLTTQAVTCNTTNGDSAGSIGFPNDTAYPKQQTGGAIGNYSVQFIDPFVSLP